MGNGLKPLIFILQLAFSKLFPNGIIYHIIPYWVSYREQTNIADLNTKCIIPKDKINWKVTSKDLLDQVDNSKPHIIIFNNPCNPTGCYYTKSEIKNLASTFEKLNSIVFSDDIYEEIIYKNDFGQLKNYYLRTITGSSLSKMVACGGYRFGWLVFPELKCPFDKLYNNCQILASSIYSCPSLMFQYLTVDLYNKKLDLSYYFYNQIKIFKSINKLIREKLKSTKLIYSDSQAAWYILLNFENYKDYLKN